MARARDLGIRVGLGRPGPLNAITDVAGVRVGHVTLIRGDGPRVVGRGPVRTGVTVVEPRPGRVRADPVVAGFHALNGNGELTGTHWVRHGGLLSTPIAITNTHSVGIVRDALVTAEREALAADAAWSMPVVGETWDGILNDVDGQHVTAADTLQALASAAGGPVAEGAVGGGTGMICHGFKGGVGTASRALAASDGGWTVGALVQANHGRRADLRVDGLRVGESLGPDRVPLPYDEQPVPAGTGSIIVVLATDAPLLPGQCERLAQRATVGLGRAGGGCEDGSGDIFLCFATGNSGLPRDGYATAPPDTVALRTVPGGRITPLLRAAAEATEEAILNALLGAETMTGADGATAHALTPELLREGRAAAIRALED